MTKIPDWSRRRDIEGNVEEYANKNVKTVRAWQNENNNAIALLEMFKHGGEKSTSYKFKVSDEKKFYVNVSQKEAIQKAVSWMKEHPYEEVELQGDKLHSKLLEVGKKVEPKNQGIANDLEDEDVDTIVSTVAFFDTEGAAAQTKRDLGGAAQYRVFDWLGMMLDTDWDNEQLEWLFEELAKIYLQEKDVDGFIHQLRMRDLQVGMPSELRRR